MLLPAGKRAVQLVCVPSCMNTNAMQESQRDETADAWAFDLRQHTWRRLMATPPLRRWAGSGSRTLEHLCPPTLQLSRLAVLLCMTVGLLKAQGREMPSRLHTSLPALPMARRMGVPPAGPQARGEHAAWVHEDWMYVYGEPGEGSWSHRPIFDLLVDYSPCVVSECTHRTEAAAQSTHS